MNGPLFSIIIPVYNSQEYIEECIESVLSQKCNEYEIIIVDDGSTDRSGEISDKYAKLNDNIKVYHKKNQGPLQSRLYGLKQAKGEYCIYLDSDDYLEPDSISYFKNIIKDYNCDCIVLGIRSFIHGKTTKVYAEKEDILINYRHDIIKKFFSSYEYNSISRKVFKKKLYSWEDLSSFYYLRKGEDLLQSMEIIRNCNSVFFTKKVLYNYRMNEKSLTHNLYTLPNKVDFSVSEKALLFVLEEGQFNEHELDLYRKNRIRESLLPMIKKIALADGSKTKKVELLKSIRESYYYKQFLGKKLAYSANGLIALSILFLLRCGLYKTLIALLQFSYNVQKKRTNV